MCLDSVHPPILSPAKKDILKTKDLCASKIQRKSLDGTPHIDHPSRSHEKGDIKRFESSNVHSHAQFFVFLTGDIQSELMAVDDIVGDGDIALRLGVADINVLVAKLAGDAGGVEALMMDDQCFFFPWPSTWATSLGHLVFPAPPPPPLPQ